MFINESKTVQMWKFDSSLEVNPKKGREETRREKKGTQRKREEKMKQEEGRGEGKEASQTKDITVSSSVEVEIGLHMKII